jgi:RHS repeat-associated protein
VLVRTDLATNDKTKVVHGLGVLYEKRPDGSLRWLHYDHLGNTVALTNSAGAVTGRASYSLWGMQHSTSGDVQSTPFLYNGRFGVVTEAASGCLHMRARWYNPRMRRFLSSDPAGFDGGWNMFAYGNGNPLAMVDPFGLGARSSNESGFWTDSYMNDSRQKTAALTAQVNALNEKNANYAARSQQISAATHPSADIAKQNWYPVGVSYGQREAYDQAQATKQALWDGAVLAASLTPIGRAEAVAANAGSYFISGGVRRSLASQMNGVGHISATIVRAGQADVHTTLRLEQLYSPKFSVPYDSRLFNIQPPIRIPIEVQLLGIPGQPASIPLNKVRIVPPGGG